MVCGGCGRSGHNIRTCQGQDYPIPTITVNIQRCGGCGQSGHNMRTCQRQDTLTVPVQRPVVPKTSAGQNARVSQQKRVEEPRAPKTLGVPSRGRSKSPSAKREFSTLSAVRQEIDEVSKLTRALRSDCQGLKGIHKEIKEEVKNKEVKAPTKTSPDKPKPTNAPGPSKTQPKDNVLTNDVQLEKKSTQPVKLNKSGKAGENWLNPKAHQKLHDGPPDQDGDGYVYIYEIAKPKNEDDKNRYKIGHTKDLPDRRVKQQEKANEEQYKIIYSGKTTNRKLTEKVIHYQLEPFRDARETGEGKTEWFTGDKDLFLSTVKKATREVNVTYN